MARILLVDDDPDIRAILADRLATAGHEVLQAEDGMRALELHAERLPDLLLLDLDLPGADGFSVLERLRQDGAPFTAVVITAYASIEKAVEAMRRGAYDFIPKPFNPGHVELVVNKALEHARLREENRVLRAEVRTPSRSMIGASSSLAQLTETARRAADSKSTILLLGESGTGKEVLARAIHAWSPRARSPFVAVNCSALSEELLESELFGHERGAFTGAQYRRKGRFEMADGGTLFLD
ncbi:MAG: sigma-54-dependent transcriptional regulator, partial [Candidatus Binatia bacterium]